MSCEFDGAEFRAFDGATVAIASNRQNFIVSDYKTGAFTITPTSTIDAYQPALTFDLGAVNATATHVCGQFSVKQSQAFTGAGVINGAWHLIGGTTPVYAGTHKMFPGGFDARYEMYLTGTNDFASYIDITFQIVSSRLKAIVSRYYPFDPDNGVRPQLLRLNAVVTYHAFCVSFDN